MALVTGVGTPGSSACREGGQMGCEYAGYRDLGKSGLRFFFPTRSVQEESL